MVLPFAGDILGFFTQAKRRAAQVAACHFGYGVLPWFLWG